MRMLLTNCQYRAVYNNRPSNAIFFMSAIASASGRLHSEFVCLLFVEGKRFVVTHQGGQDSWVYFQQWVSLFSAE
jgi:hypothetical protein